MDSQCITPLEIFHPMPYNTEETLRKTLEASSEGALRVIFDWLDDQTEVLLGRFTWLSLSHLEIIIRRVPQALVLHGNLASFSRARNAAGPSLRHLEVKIWHGLDHNCSVSDLPGYEVHATHLSPLLDEGLYGLYTLKISTPHLAAGADFIPNASRRLPEIRSLHLATDCICQHTGFLPLRTLVEVAQRIPTLTKFGAILLVAPTTHDLEMLQAAGPVESVEVLDVCISSVENRDLVLGILGQIFTKLKVLEVTVLES